MARPQKSSGKSSRRVTPQAREEFRRTLIDIARRIFLTEGYASVSIRRITAEAGVTSMTFYWYFDSKEALLAVIWDDIFQEVVQYCQSKVGTARSPRKRLLRYVEAFMDYWLEHPDRYRFVFANEAARGGLEGLRSGLTSQPGVHCHVQAFDQLATACYEDHPLRSEQVAKLRWLAVYRALGFLHCAICIYAYTHDEAQAYKQLVMQEVDASIDLWNPAGLASPGHGRKLPAEAGLAHVDGMHVNPLLRG